MKKIITIIIFIAGYINLSVSQNLQQIFFEDFINNDFGWYTVQNQYDVMKVENGEYHLQQLLKAPDYLTWIGCGIEEDKDFSVESIIRFNSGTEGNYGLVWGLKNEKNYFSFLISANGKFLVRVMNDQTMLGIIKKSASSTSIKTSSGAKNVLKISKTGQNLAFYINSTEVFTMPFESFYGNSIGFCIDMIVDVSVESLKVFAPRNYELENHIGSLTKMRVFGDHFENNANNWAFFNDENASSAIINSSYVFTSKKKEKAHLAKKAISLPIERDYIIDCMTKKMSGEIISAYGIKFGKTGLMDAISFLISSDGYLAILKKEGAQTTTFVNWKPCAAINMGIGKENNLIVLKKNRKLMFFINNVLVYSLENYSYSVQEVSLYVEGIEKVAFDCLNVNYLVSGNDRPVRPTKPPVR